MKQFFPTSICVLVLTIAACSKGQPAASEPSAAPTSRTTASGLTIVEVKVGDGELAAAGVRRISVGGAFARAALGAFVRAALEVRDHGTFGFAAEAIPYAEVRTYMDPSKR